MFGKKDRPLQPFEFRGETPEAYSFEEISILQAASRRPRGPRYVSDAERRRQARDEQASARTRIRVQRPVLNFSDFVPQMAAWYVLQTAGMAARRKLGSASGVKRLHCTLFDTNDLHDNIGYFDETQTAEDIERRLRDKRPGLFRSTGRVAFGALEPFGPEFKPWLGLPISSEAHSFHEDRQLIRDVIAPNAGDSGNRPHTSLGDLTVHDTAKLPEIIRSLTRNITPHLPEYAEFGPIQISVTNRSDS